MTVSLLISQPRTDNAIIVRVYEYDFAVTARARFKRRRVILFAVFADEAIKTEVINLAGLNLGRLLFMIN